MRKAKVFYDAILKAKPPTELGIAIRDGVPFDKLKEQSIEAIALTVTLYEKGLTDLVAQLAQEFREAAGRVIGAMLEHMDCVSARVGTPRGDGYVTPPAQQGPEGREQDFGIAVESGCSIQQVRRVIGAYVRAGYLMGPRRGPDAVDATTGKRSYGRMLPGPSGRRYQRVQEYRDAVTGEVVDDAKTGPKSA